MINGKIYAVADKPRPGNYTVPLFFFPFSMFPMEKSKTAKFLNVNESQLGGYDLESTGPMFSVEYMLELPYVGYYEPDFNLHQDWSESTMYDYRILAWKNEMTVIILDVDVAIMNVPELNVGKRIFVAPYLYGVIKSRKLTVTGDNINKLELSVDAKNYV
jgi:hypothetical protein